MMAEHLLVAADRYELEKLKLVCEEALCKKIDASSVAAALALAERHRCPALWEACMQFLSSSANLNAVMASDGFEQLRTGCPSALVELFEKRLRSVSNQYNQHRPVPDLGPRPGAGGPNPLYTVAKTL